jgi:hypothetical protein
MKISEILEEDVLKKGTEEIRRKEEMEGLKKENKEMKEEIKKIKEENKTFNEEIKKMKEEIIILQQELKKSKFADDDEKSYNELFPLYFIFFFSFWFRSC